MAVAAVAGFGTSMLHFWTNQDDAHVTAAATVATTDEMRWRAHDTEHNRMHFENIRLLSDLRQALALIETLKIAIASARKEAVLYDQGYDKAARREAAKTDALLMPREPPLPRTKINSRRTKIADMEITLKLEQIQKKAKELYPK